MTYITEELLNDESIKKKLTERMQQLGRALCKVKEGWSKLKEGCSELSEVLEDDDLSFAPSMAAKISPELAAEITNALQSRGLLYEASESVPPPSSESAPAVAAIPLPMAEERKPKRRGKPLKDLFREATTSAKWMMLCREFFAPHMNDEIDSSLSNRVLQRFAWFLSVWQEADLLVTQIFSPAIRFLKSLGFRLGIGFQTCNNALREIFARREDYQDAKSEVLAFCMAHA
ncbi:MAG: hypothetical protein II200_07995 [Bacteroidaceae bacterium]|nr:hypothetical protein [Bacteroidaceae bacterium]